MSAYQVDVIEDEAMPSSGAAVIRINGLATWPQGATIRLRPIDDAAVPPQAEGWPWGDLMPDRVIAKAGGVDVVLGPDVVSSPRLVPGTPVAVEISAANIEADVRWPAIAPTQRRRVAAVAMSASQLLAAKTERERVDKEAATRRQQMAEAATQSVLQAAQEARFTVPPAPGPSDKLARLTLGWRGDATKDQRASVKPSAREARPQATPHASIASGLPSTQTVRPSWSTMAAFAGGMAAMAVVGLGLALFAPAAIPGRANASRVAAAANDTFDGATLAALFKDIADAGNMSPKQKSALNVDIPTALSLADHNLRGQRTAGETTEADFWLKRALGSTLTSADIGWGMTQLGTLYARPDTPQHSYAKARALWQLAAAQGDPVARCFLGAVYEHGLGVAADHRAARGHYQAADSANACPSAKDAIARLKD